MLIIILAVLVLLGGAAFSCVYFGLADPLLESLGLIDESDDEADERSVSDDEEADETEEDAKEEETDAAADTEDAGSADEQTDGQTEGQSEEQADGSEEEAWAAAYSDLFGSLKTSSGALFASKDINEDGVPEEILIDDTVTAFYTVKPDGTTASVSFDNAFCAIDERKGLIIASSVKDQKMSDVTYEITDQGFSVVEEGTGEMSLDREAQLVIDCEIDGKREPSRSYISWASRLYGSAIPLSDLTFADAWDHEADKSYSYETDFDYAFDKTVDVFIAPKSGTYKLNLKGGAGGADGQRVVDGTAYYDGDGAQISGTVRMNAGERLFIVVGGAGGVTSTKASVVEGGFNGGGDSYWSGGGGGSTDVYYDGLRIVSAAGGGGGNYDQYGEAGRVSSDSKNITNDKRGGGTGSTGRDDAGAGGGAGWYGGTAGKTDAAGHGGVNGFDSKYFTKDSEKAGKAKPKKNKADGSASVSMQ
ncbi:MAG: hypothetical protein K6C95_05095 [Lachnospiraceae bacterium]|nr:hypothetical protein [Lachnospiraceae bacterium]